MGVKEIKKTISEYYDFLVECLKHYFKPNPLC